MDSLWKRNCVSNGSSVILEILLPSSAINSDDSGFQGPPVSTEIGTKRYVVASVLYLEILFAAALIAAAPALSADSDSRELSIILFLLLLLLLLSLLLLLLIIIYSIK